MLNFGKTNKQTNSWKLLNVYARSIILCSLIFSATLQNTYIYDSFKGIWNRKLTCGDHLATKCWWWDSKWHSMSSKLQCLITRLLFPWKGDAGNTGGFYLRDWVSFSFFYYGHSRARNKSRGFPTDKTFLLLKTIC